MFKMEEITPTEAMLTPEIKESIRSVTAHEGAHAFVSLHLGIPLMKIELPIDGSKHSGVVVWNDLQG